MLDHELRYTVGPGVGPLRSFNVYIDKNQFGVFEKQMYRFGATFGFEDKSRQARPEPFYVLFFMRRNEVDLISNNDTETGETNLKYSIDLYPKLDGSAPPPPPEKIDVLVEGLRKFLTPVNGAVLTEMTRPR